MEGKKVLQQLTPYQQGKQIKDIKAQYGLDRIVKLASNENPYGFSSRVAAYMKTNEPVFEIYPDGHTAELRTAIAERLNVKEDQLLFGSGSEEIVQMICRAYLYPGVNTVMAAPTFPQYKHNALIEGAEVREIPTKDGHHDLDQMLEAIDDNTAVVWVCSPNNPTGSTIAKESLYDFLDRCPKHAVIALDEAYYEYMSSSADPEAISHLASYPNLIILRTFSKAYGLAGLRIGYAIANATLIAALNVVRGPFNTTSLAQQAALIAWNDQDFIEETRRKNLAVKKSFQQFLKKTGWHYYDSETNFILVFTPVSGEKAFQYLLEHGFIVRPGEAIGCPGTIRITLGAESDMKRLQETLKELR
ncbi:histidinol-phosphate transaminase [Lentibacillus sediminis]|uniref:histidinol-phosphate transaminase n=1 Tax=Lentibacillus sediminis TaxID=1940529 RepID=UPI000C1BE3B4|nr:histidinol-phosphate transaminase [Lentibacillus sediminis]